MAIRDPKGIKKLVNRGKRTQFKKGDKRCGRKPLAVELKAREFILKVMNGEPGLETLVKKIFTQALKGSFKHQELLLNYILGRPVEKIKIDNAYGSTPVVSAPVVKIIADTLRLQRLEKDAEEVVEPDRIEEAEAILEAAITHSPPVEQVNGVAKKKVK